MKIEMKEVESKVNCNAITAIIHISKNKYPNMPMFFGGIDSDKLPCVVCLFDNSITADECCDMEDVFRGSLEDCYSEQGECLYESEPNYDDTLFQTEEEFDKVFFEDERYYGFYALNGELYDSREDVGV